MSDTGFELKSSRNRKSASNTATLVGTPSSQSTLSQFLESEVPGNTPDLWDELGSEASDHAQIWQVYNEESNKLDASTMDGLNRGIDVLLVFTGLFSAVLTTFIIEAYQQVLPNSSDTTNALLLQLISDLRSSSLNITHTQITLPAPSYPAPSMAQLRWVNGLWFAALSCSLSAALISMLAKQWIQPIPKISSSPRHRARQRQLRHMQLKNWHVFVVINTLPLLLHVALLLFFSGIIILLWSGNIAIMMTTIVSVAYIFYIGSMWMSLVCSDCPYQHPISEHLRQWIAKRNPRLNSMDLEKSANESHQSMRIRIPMTPPIVSDDDYVDASSLVWLLQQFSDDDTVKTTLQAIGGLPRGFSAFHVLRDAGAISMVLHHFSSCFNRDVSFKFNTRWQVVDPEGAERFCRAWVRLTHGTSESWPSELRAPLATLKNMTDNLHVSAIAACASALDSLESRNPQIAVISHLDRVASGESTYSEPTQRWLLDTLLECSLSWELKAAVVNDIGKRAIPVLLKLLQRATNISGSQSRTTIALILHTLTVGKVTSALVWDEEKRRLHFHKFLIPSLAFIIQNFDHFEVDPELLDFMVTEFSRRAAPLSGGFPPHVKDIACQGLSKLYLEGRIGVGLVPDSVLADILQILHPPVNITLDQRPLLVKNLVRNLTISVNVNVAIRSVQLLEPLLTDCQSSVIRAFTEEGGIPALLCAAHTGDTDCRRLQLSCIRTICIFIRSITQVPAQDDPRCPSIEMQFDAIFESDFFATIISAVGARRWWLAEIAEIWVPSLLHLYRARPHEQIWRSVETVFRNFAEINIGEDGLQKLVNGLDEMKTILDPPT